jgi:hypothetical protein
MTSNKKNTPWTAVPEMGSYYRYDHDTLLFCPMTRNGERATDDEIGEVDTSVLDEQSKKAIRDVVNHLR